MKLQLLTMLALSVLANHGIAAQEGSKPQSAQAWIEQLGSDSHAKRQEAERALEKLGPKAVEALRKAAKDDSASEVQWRAKELLARIQDGDRKKAKGLEPLELPPRWKPKDLDSMFGSIFDRLEQDFGLDIPRRKFFDDSFFTDLREQIQEMEKRMPKLGKMGMKTDGQSNALEIRIGPDGVRVEVRKRDKDGKVDSKTYTAPDLDTFRDKYPEIARQYLNREGRAFSWKLDPNDFFGKRPMRGHAADALAGRGPTLGVMVRGLGSELRRFLDLEPGQGLLVEKVIPDSLASRLEILPQDIILEIDGRRIGSSLGVKAALKKAKGQVQVHVNRKGKMLKLNAKLTESDKGKDAVKH